MGTAFSSIPGIGVISGWPDIGTFALVNKLYAIAYYRISSVAEHRANKKYVMVDTTNGSSAGGGGTGTLADPYKVRHMADLRTLVAAILVTNLTIYLRRGDVFEASAANTAQGINLNVANVSLSSYEDAASPSNEKPMLTAFRTVTGGVTGGSGVYTYTITGLRAYWARARLAGTTQSNWFDQPYKRMNSTVGAGNNDYEFYDNTTGTVTVKVGSHDYQTMQFAYATGPGINITDVDNVGVFGIASEGWGMDAPGTAGGGFCAKSECTGNNEHLWYGCRFLGGPYHVSGHIVNPGTGGITTWVYCNWGLWQWDSGGGGDANVAFASSGDHECIRLGCNTTHGALWAEGQNNIRGTNPYSHSGSGATPNRLLIELDCNHVPSWGGYNGYTMCATVSAPTDNRQVQYYRMFVHNQQIMTGVTTVSDSGIALPDTLFGVFTNCKITLNNSPPGGAFGTPFSVGTNAALRCAMVNTSITMNLTGIWTGKSLVPLWSTSTAHDFDFVHGAIRITGTAPGNSIIWQPSTQVKSSSMWNCIMTNETGKAAASTNLTGATDYFREADPASAAGGFSACAFLGYLSTEYDGTPGYKTITQAQATQSLTYPPDTLINAGLPLPTGLKCEFDINMAGRNTTASKTTIGPIEARPITTALRAAGRLGFAKRTKRLSRFGTR